ncbi:MAG TPA: hypothetical protein PK961_08030 [bacterium]|nr:hypothetical protein [bacterium]
MLVASLLNNQKIKALIEINPENLIREKEFGEKLSFTDAAKSFEKIQKLIVNAITLDIDIKGSDYRQLESALSELSPDVIRILRISEREDSFSQFRNDVTKKLEHHYDIIRLLEPYIYYNKQESLEKKVHELESDGIKDENNYLLKMKEEMRKDYLKLLTEYNSKIDNVQNMVYTLQPEIVKKGTEEYKNQYKDQAQKHKNASIIFFIAGLMSVILSLFAVYFLFLYQHNETSYFALLATCDANDIFCIARSILARLVILSIFSYLIYQMFRLYSINKNLQVIFTHKENAIQTSQFFLNATTIDSQAKNAIIVQLANAIYSLNCTGYISSDGEKTVVEHSMISPFIDTIKNQLPKN